MPIAEQQGRTEELGGWVVNRAAADVARWRTKRPTVRVAVALSQAQLDSGHTLGRIEAVLDRHGLSADGLILEINAKTFYGAARDGERNRTTAETAVGELARLGLGVLLDEFGCTHASFDTLRRLPFEMLRLDGSLTAALISPVADSALLSSALALTDALGILAIASRVETARQYDRLNELGIAFAQGRYVALPQPSSEVETHLHRWNVLDRASINLR
jgi:EAL domain-containing protein (putative c-di-GMP-specific phosphodiesterase class I)